MSKKNSKLLERWLTFQKQRLEDKVKKLTTERQDLKKMNIKLVQNLKQEEQVSNSKIHQLQLTMTQISEEHDANNRKIILENNELKREISDLTVKEQVGIDKMKDLREEHLKTRSSYVEKEEEFKSQIKQVKSENDKLHHSLEQEKKLVEIRNEQIIQLETNLKQ